MVLIISSVVMTKGEGRSEVIKIEQVNRCHTTPWLFHCAHIYKMCNTKLISQLPTEVCLNF